MTIITAEAVSSLPAQPDMPTTDWKQEIADAYTAVDNAAATAEREITVVLAELGNGAAVTEVSETTRTTIVSGPTTAEQSTASHHGWRETALGKIVVSTTKTAVGLAMEAGRKFQAAPAPVRLAGMVAVSAAAGFALTGGPEAIWAHLAHLHGSAPVAMGGTEHVNGADNAVQQATDVKYVAHAQPATPTAEAHAAGTQPAPVDLKAEPGNTTWQNVVDAARAAHKDPQAVWTAFQHEVTRSGGTVSHENGYIVVQVPDGQGGLTSNPDVIARFVGDYSRAAGHDHQFTDDGRAIVDAHRPHAPAAGQAAAVQQESAKLGGWGAWLNVHVGGWAKYNWTHNVYPPLKAAHITDVWDKIWIHHPGKWEHAIQDGAGVLVPAAVVYKVAKGVLRMAGGLVGAFARPVGRAWQKGKQSA